jgi:hypothetical protein
MNSRSGSGLAFAIVAATGTTSVSAEELVAKLHDTVKFNIGTQNLSCDNGAHAEDALGVLQNCKSPSIANEAWGNSPQALRNDQNQVFIVYTKKEVDDKIEGLRSELTASLQKGLGDESSALKETEKVILDRIDKLSTTLPADSRFYNVMLDRLKSDVTGVIDVEINKLRPMVRKPGQ